MCWVGRNVGNEVEMSVSRKLTKVYKKL